MINGSLKLGHKYIASLTLWNKFRAFSDGITFFKIECDLDLYEGHHKPSFVLGLTVLNVELVCFEIYNRFHLDVE